MKRSTRPWLDLAVRAHQIMSLDAQREAQIRREALDAARQRSEAAAQDRIELLQAWSQTRASARSDAGLDTQYQRFHAFQLRRAEQLAQQQAQCEHDWQAARQLLERCFGTQKALEQLAQRHARAQAQQRRTRELDELAESWLMSRQAREGMA